MKCQVELNIKGFDIYVGITPDAMISNCLSVPAINHVELYKLYMEKLLRACDILIKGLRLIDVEEIK